MTGQKTALVTGGNRGIGREIVRRLALDGHAVWIGCRDRGAGEAAAAELAAGDVSVRVLQLDVSDELSVRAAARVLASETDRLDVLVNNAGTALAPSGFVAVAGRGRAGGIDSRCQECQTKPRATQRDRKPL